MNGQALIVRKLLPASCEEVFDAWLDADGMREWMAPGPVTSCDVAIDPQVGGNFRFVMRAPGAQYVSTGQFRVLDRPARLQFTWVSSRWAGHETLVTIELHPRGAHCELVLTHERFPVDHSSEELTNGLTQILEKLGRYLQPTGGSQGPTER